MISIDLNLCPQNCEEVAMEWVADIYYVPGETFLTKSDEDEIKNLIEKGYRLGEPMHKNTLQNGFVGLYKPLK